MTFLHIIPWWVNLPLAVAGLVLCFLGWKAVRMRPGSARMWARRMTLVVVVALMGLTPATISYWERASTNLAIYFVVDATGSMAAEDYNGSSQRLEGVRADLVQIAESIPGARYSIIEFSSTATLQMPLTNDLRAVRSWADTYDREITDYSFGSDINRPVEELTAVLEQAALSRPDDVRIVFYFGDGESTNARKSSADAQPQFSGLAQYIDGGYVLGYGTAAGGQMLRKDYYDGVKPGDYIIDPGTGAPAVSIINEDALKTVAAQLEVDYEHRTAPGDVSHIAAVAQPTDEITEDGERPVYAPVIWPLAIILTLLLAWEIWELVPRVKAVRALGGRTGPGGHSGPGGYAGPGGNAGATSGMQTWLPGRKTTDNSGWLT
ncbi:MAG: VWA domain-containing protein [Actinomycetaceae bacterium]|nr:VWA domain-containing protein [Actinomycetaceae bacterium]